MSSKPLMWPRLPTVVYLMVWQSQGQDGDQNGAFARRFDVDGEPQDAAEFQVNNQTAGIQRDAKAAALAGGGFVVVWHSQGVRGDWT